MSQDGAAGRGSADGETTAVAPLCPVASGVADPRPWPERQPHVLWLCVFDSGHLTQGDAYKCMQVSRQWRDCVNGAKGLWRRIEFGYDWQSRRAFHSANWTDATADAIAAKRPKELVFRLGIVCRRHQLSAILERSAQLRRLQLRPTAVDTVHALDSLQAPLRSLHVASPTLDHAHFARIVASAPVLKQLNELHLDADVGDASAQLIAAHFTQLSVLHMDRFSDEEEQRLTPAALGHLCAATAHTRTSLRRLELSRWCFRGGDSIQHILAMPSLETLRVMYGSDQEVAELASAYRQRHGRGLVVRN